MRLFLPGIYSTNNEFPAKDGGMEAEQRAWNRPGRRTARNGGKKSRILIKPRALEFKEHTNSWSKRCDKTIFEF